MDKKLKQLLVNGLKARGATRIDLFGSYARGEQTKKSDIDVIVKFKSLPTLFEYVRMRRELKHELGVSVDLLTEDAISPFIKPHIQRVRLL